MVFPVSTTDKSSNVTTSILGCGNVLSYQIPLYFVLPGARMRQTLLDGCTPGTEFFRNTRWSDAEFFRIILELFFTIC